MKKLYLVSYDLNAPGQDYKAAIQAIKDEANGWWHHLDSIWIIISEKSAAQLRDALQPHFGNNDELLVVRLAHGAAWFGFNAKGSNWLKDNLKVYAK